MNHLLKIFIVIILLISMSPENFSKDWDRVVNLRGKWKFSIGDDKEWAAANYNDKSWEEIFVPSSWEDEGFHGYNGYAWYRTSFNISSVHSDKVFYLFLGNIDDVDEVFVNGKLVGRSGAFPPNYQTAYYSDRKYPVPNEFLNFSGSNTIAVRVFDSQLSGGILRGDIGLYIRENTLNPDISLEGYWKFNIGDEFEWKETSFNDKDWHEILVPSIWETQGYQDYDGFAWYRKTIEIPSPLLKQKLVLILGRIDDIDEVYLNGKLIGSTGNMELKDFYAEYQAFRGYYIPDNVLKEGTNLIAVRVYDGYKEGGIYSGPIGIITQKKYTDFWRSYRKEEENIFERIFRQ